MTASSTISAPAVRVPDAAGRRLESLSVVLPCFDEAENVAGAIREADEAAGRFALEHEVIVVDDGSADATRVLAEAVAARNPRVRVVAHDHNRGYGAAVRSGIDASRSTWVLLTDGDLQFDLEEIELMLPLTREYEVVAGYRIARADPALRRFAAHAWNGLMRRTFGVTVRDVDCAFKLVRGDAVRSLGLESDGAMISTELYVRAALRGLLVAEVGVHHRPRRAGVPTGGDPRVVLRAFGERRALLRRLRDADRAEARGGRLHGLPKFS
ncbi:MAG: glycosyltransferase family 2 protein [Solirubrobacteraceae bacterium]